MSLSQLLAEAYTSDRGARGRDECSGENVFWVPKAARGTRLQASVKQPTIGKLIDEALRAIEKENPSIEGVLPKHYACESVDKRRLGELIDLIGTIGLADKVSRSKDVLGRVYKYFLGSFAAGEVKKGGQFYTPRSAINLVRRGKSPGTRVLLSCPGLPIKLNNG